MNEPDSSARFDLEATIMALGLGEMIGRRNYEAYRDWAKLERDWLELEELEHLQRAMSLAKKRNRSLRHSLERTKTLETTDGSSSEPASLTEMIQELRNLRCISEDSRRHQDALLSRLRTEDSYYAAWEARLRRNEEEVLALWNLIDEVIRLSSASVPRLEKLEKRVGYELRRTHTPTAQPRTTSSKTA